MGAAESHDPLNVEDVVEDEHDVLYAEDVKADKHDPLNAEDVVEDEYDILSAKVVGEGVHDTQRRERDTSGLRTSTTSSAPKTWERVCTTPSTTPSTSTPSDTRRSSRASASCLSPRRDSISGTRTRRWSRGATTYTRRSSTMAYLTKLFAGAEKGKEKLAKVKVSNRLEETPAVIVTGQYGDSANVERIIKAQAFSSDGGNAYLMSAKTTELNARHPGTRSSATLALVRDGDDADKTKGIAWMLYDMACVVGGNCGGVSVGATSNARSRDGSARAAAAAAAAADAAVAAD